MWLWLFFLNINQFNLVRTFSTYWFGGNWAGTDSREWYWRGKSQLFVLLFFLDHIQSLCKFYFYWIGLRRSASAARSASSGRYAAEHRAAAPGVCYWRWSGWARNAGTQRSAASPSSPRSRSNLSGTGLLSLVFFIKYLLCLLQLICVYISSFSRCVVVLVSSKFNNKCGCIASSRNVTTTMMLCWSYWAWTRWFVLVPSLLRFVLKCRIPFALSVDDVDDIRRQVELMHHDNLPVVEPQGEPMPMVSNSFVILYFVIFNSIKNNLSFFQSLV